MNRRMRLAALLVTVVATVTMVSSGSAEAATITPVGGSSYHQDHISTFYQFDQFLGVIFATVRTDTHMADSTYYYDPGAPYTVSDMLGGVRVHVNEVLNVGAVNWSFGFQAEITGVGSLNSYFAYMPLDYQRNLTCNLLPPAKYCWRALPDWLLSPGLTLSMTYNLQSALPWAVYLNSANGSISFGWW